MSPTERPGRLDVLPGHLDALPEYLEELLGGIERRLDRAAELRQAVHADPHIGGEEGPTRELVRQWLPGLASEEVADTGLVVRVGDQGPAVGIRAELDALPMDEQTDVPWRATNGAAHACGHDVHLAATWALLDAARELSDVLPAPVVGLFQPREEDQPSGARDFVTAGVIDRYAVGAVVAAHLQPILAPGVISTGAGPVNAAFDEFEIIVHGSPGHGAYPHAAVDPVPILANVVTASHELVSRVLDPTHPAVISIGSLAAGGSANVIAAEASCTGVIRTTSEQDRTTLHDALRRLALGIADARGASATVDIDLGGPELVNDPALVAHVDALLAAAGTPVTRQPFRSCGSDDFSYFSAEVPGLMMFLGVASACRGPDESMPGLHHPSFLPPPESIGETARALAFAYAGAAELLAQQGSRGRMR